MFKKNGKINKNGTAIIVAIIGAIALIVSACISCSGSIQYYESELPEKIDSEPRYDSKVVMSENVSKENSEVMSEENTEEKSEDIPENVLQENSEDNADENSENTMSGNNSGVIIFGNNSGVIHNNEEKIFSEEKVRLTGELNKTVVYGENDEIINAYYDDSTLPVCNFQITNENEGTIGIEHVFVEVVNCNIFNENTNIIPDSGSGMTKMIFWSCNISTDNIKYQAELHGTDKNNTEDLSNTEFVKIDGNDIVEFIINIHPNTPGVYETNIIVEYRTYEGEIKEKVLPNINFTYKPNNEVNIEPTLD